MVKKHLHGPARTTRDTRELRLNTSRQHFEIRKNADGSRSISGYAVVWNSLSEDLGGFKERISPGSFKQSLKDNPDVMCLYGHDQNQILGRVSSGTVTVAEDAKGLRFSCTLPDTSTARDLTALIERGDISQMSFGFQCLSDSWTEVNGQVIRTVTEAVLFEVSVVGSPAYTSTSVNLRSAPKAIRAKLKRSKTRDVDDPDDDDTEDDDCECDCDSCATDDCPNCTDEDCDEDCRDCPMQAAAETDTLRMRLKLAQHRAKRF
jgi:uncharacterized protein